MSQFPDSSFAPRHIGPDAQDTKEMLDVIGAASLDALIDSIVPKGIRTTKPLDLPEPLDEHEYLKHMRHIAAENKLFKSFIGLGYYGTITPSVISRNLFENPGWYTQYTPYQAEIAQGRLESLLNFQTMVCDLTALPVANASLLDEATAAAEAMMLFYHNVEANSSRHSFFAADNCLPQTLDVLKLRAEPLGIKLVIGDTNQFDFNGDYFGALLQYPDKNGALVDHRDWIAKAHQAGLKVAMAADLLALCLVTAPGEMDADVALGSAQRFGVPMGFGGPHAAYFACKDEFKRLMPGRIIGVSIDAEGRQAYRMALQTREQHIRREKATSNICTAQALLANIAAMYAVYHGPDGLKRIASEVHEKACALADSIKGSGYRIVNEQYFDTIYVDTSSFGHNCYTTLHQAAVAKQFNLGYSDECHFRIALDEATTWNDVEMLAQIFAHAAGHELQPLKCESVHSIPKNLRRTSSYLAHPVFNKHHSETEMMRYLKTLENKDLSLTNSMIPLGSCTMKLNAASEMYPVSFPEFAHQHPFAPMEQVQGYARIIKELEQYLANITGFAACSLQPNSGAQGEYAGLMVIRAYHIANNQAHRNVVLIPQSAHGTNPASAVMAGLNVVVVKTDENGNIDVQDLEAKAQQHSKDLSCLMVTYPSTHGVFEENIKQVCDIVHKNGGQVYMDGANMNAQVGLTSPAAIGADVNHINLHKTFSIPHGGGGPGMGPICCAKHLAPFLPGHSISITGGANAIHAVSAAAWGSASILLISYGYIRMLGAQGCTDATKYAMLNANYLKARLQKEFKILYEGRNGFCAHEFILDMREYKKYGIEVEDVAKRLMDYGFHAPTVSFPVPGTLMIEPTESEPKEELDRFAIAMLSIKREIQEVIDGMADAKDNVLKNAPHTQYAIASDDWNHSYSRMKAAYPVAYLRDHKFWASVSRINNTYGDRNLICTCPPLESYEQSFDNKQATNGARQTADFALPISDRGV